MKRVTCLFQTMLLTVWILPAVAQSRAAVVEHVLLPPKGIYRFPAFIEGTIIFRNGMMSSAKINYNIISDEMHFLDAQGDTLSVADPETISFISCNNSRFYYDKGYLQTLDTNYSGLVLAYRQTLDVQQDRKGAYGTVRPHEGARTYSYYTGNGQTFKLGADEAIRVSTKELFYFGDGYGHFLRAGKNAVYTRYPGHQAAIAAFIKSRHISFHVEEDLLSLLEFCRAFE